MTKIAERTFHYADQERFATASGDRNPMHMDPVLARRTQAGAPVVHGMHLLLWSLESLAALQPGPFRGLRAQFNSFVYLDEPVELVITRQTPSAARLRVTGTGFVRAKIVVDFGESVDPAPDWAAAELSAVCLTATPKELTFESMQSRSGCIPLSPEAITAIFPAAAAWIGAQRVTSLAASTFLVGMICPGLHSIYSEIAVVRCDRELSNQLAFRVTECDERFRSVEHEICGGGLIGFVKAFARHAPVQQRDLNSLRQFVQPNAFEGSVALVIGGSRGLGELTAKLLACGGSRVIITWHAGRTDADRVGEEIRSAGGVCDVVGYDVHNAAEPQLAALPAMPTHAYFYASPVIYRPQSEVFSANRLKDLLAVYVDGFWQLSQALRAQNPRVRFFYPSSVFVEDRPHGMSEYAMAKAAGEVLCAELNASQAPMHVEVARLPRLPTDQTASITASETADPVAMLLPILRKVQSGTC